MEGKLYKSRQNKYIGGICGGLGDYLSIDPTILRLIMVLLTFATSGIFAIVYIALCFIIPYPEEDRAESAAYRKVNESASRAKINNTKQRKYLGIILIILGSLMFLSNILPHDISKFIVPTAALIIGLALVISAFAVDSDEEDEIKEISNNSTGVEESGEDLYNDSNKEEISFITPIEESENEKTDDVKKEESQSPVTDKAMDEKSASDESPVKAADDPKEEIIETIPEAEESQPDEDEVPKADETEPETAETVTEEFSSQESEKEDEE